MDQYTLAHVRITNLLAEAVANHDKVAHAVDIITKEKQTGEVTTALKDAGPIFKKLTDIYKEVRDAAIVFEYLAGHDLYSISNDFKIGIPAIRRILIKADIKLT